jgi:hypothetical protein
MSLVGNVLDHFLPKEMLCHIFSEYLSLQDISRFDIAICDHEKRSVFLGCIGSLCWPGDKKRSVSSEEMFWLSSRNIKIRHLNCRAVTDNMAVMIAGFGIHLIWLEINKQSINDICLIRIVEGCPNLRSLDISICDVITDTSVIRIAECCYHLEKLNIGDRGFRNVTDKIFIRIAEGCRI